MTSTRFPAWMVLLAALAAGVPAAAADAPQGPAEETEEQRKDLLASYGFEGEQEPKLSTVERTELIKIQPLLTSDPAAAIRKLEEMIGPESSALLDFTLGSLYVQQDDLDRAAERYRSAIAKSPAFLRANKMLGRILFQRGELEEAIVPLTRVIELGGGDGLTYRLLGYAFNATGQHLSAESAYRYSLMLNPGDMDAKRGLLQSLVKQQKYGEVAALCDELVRANPERTDLLAVQASAFVGLAQPMKAAENYELMVRMGKATPQILGTLGNIYVNEGLYQLAAGAYSRALDLEPRPASEETLRRAEFLVQRGATAEAKLLLERVSAVHGDALSLEERKKSLKLAARIAVAEGSDSAGVTALEEVVELDPMDGEALLSLGQHYARSNERERAVLYYERAEGIEAVEADARVRHAQILVQDRRYSEAIPLLKRAQELRPRDDVARYLDEVERLARSRG